MDIWILSSFGYCELVLLWMWVYEILFECLFAVLLDICPGLELLGRMIILFNLFRQ